MNSNEIKRDILRTINNIANPASITTQVITGIMRSNYTAETIRSLILDPVAEKCIPKIVLDGWEDCNLALWALYFSTPEAFVEKILKQKDMKIIDDIKQDWDSGNGQYSMEDRLPTFDKPEIMLMHYKTCIIYINWINPLKDGYIRMTIHFLGLKSGNCALDFTKNMEDIRDGLEDLLKKKFSNRVSLRTFEADGRPRFSFCTVPSTIIVDHVKKEMDSIISMVTKSEDIKKDYEIDSTVGVLLYGPAGTGKSTIARWLARELKRTLILTTADTLQDAVSYVKDLASSDAKFIMLIEDIDFMFSDRRTDKRDAASKENMEITNYFFQVLDGVLSSSNLLVIATTNYIDRLDPALIRDGRFDFKVEVNGLDYETAVKVCERFDVNPEDINLRSWPVPISPATLQATLLKYKVGADISSIQINNNESESE